MLGPEHAVSRTSDRNARVLLGGRGFAGAHPGGSLSGAQHCVGNV